MLWEDIFEIPLPPKLKISAEVKFMQPVTKQAESLGQPCRLNTRIFASRVNGYLVE